MDSWARARNEAWPYPRFPSEFAGPQDPSTVIDGQSRLLFSSSNYLGLSTHPAVVAAALAATERFGAGSGGSRLTTGSTSLHVALERRLAEFFGTEDAVFFATGYQANLSTLQVLGTDDVTIFSDSLNHASIIDGIRLSGARKVVFPHGTLPDVANRDTAHALIVTDGLFSMDGVVADVAALRELDAWLMVDDAHAVGSFGRGFGVPAGADVVVGTASKALGAEGGFVLCSAAVGTLLRNHARSFIYSTATPASTPAAIMAALDVIDSTDVVQRLHDAIRYASDCLLAAGLISQPATTPIIPIPVGDEAKAVALSQRLASAGIHVPAIRYPTVAKGKAILRVTIMATHSHADIDALVGALQ